MLDAGSFARMLLNGPDDAWTARVACGPLSLALLAAVGLPMLVVEHWHADASRHPLPSGGTRRWHLVRARRPLVRTARPGTTAAAGSGKSGRSAQFHRSDSVVGPRRYRAGDGGNAGTHHA